MSGIATGTTARKARTSSKGRGNRATTRINWQDKSVWIAIALLVAVGFGAAYGLWMRTWSLDIASEVDFYVSACLLRLRDFRTRSEALMNQRTTSALALLTSSSARLEGALAQIPRRGPVQWRGEIIGLADELRSTLETALAAHLAAPTGTTIADINERLPVLRDRIVDLEAALEATTTHNRTGRPVLNFTDEVTSQLEAAIAAARLAAGQLSGG